MVGQSKPGTLLGSISHVTGVSYLMRSAVTSHQRSQWTAKGGKAGDEDVRNRSNGTLVSKCQTCPKLFSVKSLTYR